MGVTINYGSIPNAAPIPAAAMPVPQQQQPVFVQQPEAYGQAPPGYVGSVVDGQKYSQVDSGEYRTPVAVAQPVNFKTDPNVQVAQGSPYAPPMAYNQPSIPSQRSMQVVIPNWAIPGNTITVNSPTGEVVNVTVPSNQAPGSTMIVNY